MSAESALVGADLQVFDMPEVVELARRVKVAILDRHPTLFDKDSTTVLDFMGGAGMSSPCCLITHWRSDSWGQKGECTPNSRAVTGLLAKELRPHVKSIVGVDVSQGVVRR